ncbi:MAG: amidohydrolase family protein, partial [Firmicutes bacterium]|nr:amidohydrolase family protein [Bacillota bacterium]
GGHYPEQNLTMEEAVKAHTINAAYCSFSEDRKGSIKVGKIADFVVMDKDIFSIDPETELLSTKILATYMDGEKVYEA